MQRSAWEYWTDNCAVGASFARTAFASTDTTEDELRRMLGLNAVRVYGVDVEALQPVAERIGFDADQLLQPPERPIRDFRAP